ncbi:MAG: IS110 family transposase [Anaerolineae bacterium]|nr:IS110 family transposase [Anaerolineae bacterium]
MSKRFFGFDVHKNFIVAAAVNTHQEVIVRPQKISSVDLEAWVPKHLTKNDEVVIEAMSCSWVVYDLLAQHASRVVVAHPNHVKLIAASFVKTDKRDAIALARLLAANILPEVWIPPKPVRELRSLIYHRSNLVHQRASAKCRLRGIYQQYRIVEPEGRDAFTPEYWDKLDLPPVEKLRIRHTSDDIQSLSKQLQETETLISQLSAQEPWDKDVPYLVQLPGIGYLTAMTILAAVGEVGRFPTSKKLVGYAGLGVRIHASGETSKSGGITKQGRSELRYAMIEAAWNAIDNSSFWKQKYEQLAGRMNHQKAATAIARKLLVVVWNVLSHHEVDRKADLEVVGRSLWIWGSKNRLATSLGMKRIEFAGKQLHRMGIHLEKITYCSTIYKIPATGPTEAPAESEKLAAAQKSSERHPKHVTV